MVFSPETGIVLAAAKWAHRPTFSLRAVTVLLWLTLAASVMVAAVAWLASQQARLDEAAIASGPIGDAVVVEKRSIGGGLLGQTYRLSLRYADRQRAQRTGAIDVDPVTFARATTGGSLRIAFPDARGERIIVADAAIAAAHAREMATLVFAGVLGAMSACAGLLGMLWWRATR